jgi:hypothetical protein
MPTRNDDDEYNGPIPPGFIRDENNPRMFKMPPLTPSEIITLDVPYHSHPDVAEHLEAIAKIMPSLTPTERLDVFNAFADEYCGECGGEQPGGYICQCWNDE